MHKEIAKYAAKAKRLYLEIVTEHTTSKGYTERSYTHIPVSEDAINILATQSYAVSEYDYLPERLIITLFPIQE